MLICPRTISGFAPFYTKNIYPIWQSSLGRIAGLLPFSLSELILYLLPIILVVDFVVSIRKKRLAQVFKRIVFAASLLFFLYFANCGVNYYSETFVERENIKLIEASEDTLIEFCQYTAEKIKESSDIPGATDYPSGKDLGTEALIAMKKLGAEYPSLSGFYPKPKPITNSRPFSNMGVTGIYSPFTIEANYNREITPYNLPFTACHELSHLKGYMDEGEANFIGWLACLQSENKAFNRSAYLMAWVYAGNELYERNRDAHNKIRDILPEDALLELRENNEFWDKYQTEASEVQDQINDAYLQANGLEAGIKSYDEVVVMMLSWFEENKSL